MSRRILFVDDEQRVLDALRRMLRPYSGDWDTDFVTSGQEALGKLGDEPYDVIVADMRMPGMDGAELLERVREDHPEMVRIVLSGHTELEASLRAVPIAHQFLAKPCDADVLLEVVTRSANLHHLLRSPDVARVAGRMDTLPVLPATYSALVERLADPEASLAEIADIVGQDLGIVSKIMHIVNSAFFGLSREITAVSDALNYLGVEMLKSIVLSAEVFHSFESKATSFSLADEQQHATEVAAIACRVLPDRHLRGDLYLTGMLHDIGRMVTAIQNPEGFDRVASRVKEGEKSLIEIEFEEFEVSHAEVGAYLLGIWGLPYSVVEGVAHHHNPQQIATGSFPIAAAVWLADLISRSRSRDVSGEFDEAYMAKLGLSTSFQEWVEMSEEATVSG